MSRLVCFIQTWVPPDDSSSATVYRKTMGAALVRSAAPGSGRLVHNNQEPVPKLTGDCDNQYVALASGLPLGRLERPRNHETCVEPDRSRHQRCDSLSPARELGHPKDEGVPPFHTRM